MKIKNLILVGIAACGLSMVVMASSNSDSSKSSDKTPASASAPAPAPSAAKPVMNEESMLLEGEKRFHSNCGRCHAAPRKFPPQMMGTIVRHMRVRATITDEDMRLILHYMTR